MMIRRFVATTVLSMLVVTASALPAFAWGNGGDEGEGYGTHDWVIEHAISIAGSEADWVNVETARLASNDPDYGNPATNTPKTDSDLHTYMEYGSARGGPQQVADEYYKLMTAYKAGDYETASYQLGVLSHYYSDLCQPYHAYSLGATTRNTRHYPYEVDVHYLTNDYEDKASWASPWGRSPVKDVRAEALAAAKYARTKFANLDASYKANGAVKGYAYDATGYVLRRSVNDLADIICAVDDGAGLAPAPAKVNQYMKRTIHRYPRNGQFICTSAKCYDAAGKPMEGVGVTFKWSFKTVVAYTDADGYAYNWQTIGKYSAFSKQTVGMQTASSGVVATDTTWFMPTPVLADGSAGVKTTIANNRPKRYTTVKVKTRFLTTSGKPVKGLKVDFTWYFKGGKKTMTAVTDAYGYARCSRNIGGAARGYRVYVKGHAYSGGHSRSSRASFIPQ